MTDEERKEYQRVREKWLRTNPEYLRQREAMLEAAADKAFVNACGWTCRPDDVSPAQVAEPRTPKQVWAKIVAEEPTLYSHVGTRNGNGRL